jgi:hypothetical protein
MEIGCYVHNSIRINMSKTISETIEKKQKNENQQVEFSNSKKLKSFLQSAMNTATSLTNYIPKITSELIVCINTYQSNQKNKIKLKDNSERFDTFKSLREFSYGLVDYDRSDKNNINKAFEMVVERSIRNALMSVNNFGSIQVIDNEVVAMSKIVRPVLKKENPNKKLKVKFVNVPNTDETLINVNTTNMDKMWKSFSGTDTKKPDKDKSDIKTSSVKFYNDLHKIYDLAKNKKYEKFWSIMSEETLETILNIGTLISDNTIRNAYEYCEKNQQTNGSIKKAS